MKKSKLLKISALLISFYACSELYAAEVYGKITGNSGVLWNNASPASFWGAQAIRPSAWSLAQERTTTEWYPGSLQNETNNTLTFIDYSTGGSFQTNLQLLGVEYNLGSSASRFVTKDYGTNVGAGVANECSSSDVNSSVAQVVQENGLCVSRYGYVTGTRVEPFKFYRSIFSLPSLNADIQGNSLSSGTYTATITTLPTYFFTSESGIMTFTQIVEPLTIVIEYQAAILESVSYIGDGIIDAQYDTSTKRVTGTTSYSIDLNGTLPTGVIMTFSAPSNDFSMQHETNSELKIPYTITCAVGCASPEKVIVSEGVLDTSTFPNGEVITENAESGMNRVNVVYDVSYDVDGEAINSGNYQGAFTVLYEVNL